MMWFTKPGTGAIEDPRPEEEKAKDYTFGEIVDSADPVTWQDKTFSTIRKFSVRNQKGSLTCVAQAWAKAIEVLLWLKEGVLVVFSATPIYQPRVNRPGGGMFGQNGAEIVKSDGATLEALVPSQNMTEAQIEAFKVEEYEKEVGRVFKIANYVMLPARDLDTAASTIQKTGKGIPMGFFFTSKEWSKEVPTVLEPNLTRAQALGHFVVAVDFGTYQGKQGLFIEDSAHFGGLNRRFITREFFEKRNTSVIYPIAFKFQETPLPAYEFTKVMKFGETNSEIVALQDVLKSLALFPSNTASTGYFGSITATSVEKFQVKYNLPVNGRLVDGDDIAKLNSL